MSSDEKYFTAKRYEQPGQLPDIYFIVNENINEFPDSIIKLKDDIELSILVLQKTYKEEPTIYTFFYDRIYVLADLAFNGKINQTSLAQNGLEKIKNEIIFSLAPKIRNNILLKYIKIIIIPAIISFLAFLGLFYYTQSDNSHYVGNLLLVALGSCLGCWLSLAFRTRSFKFEEIIPILSDGLGIKTRILFIIIFSISLALLMKIDVLVINLGGFSSKGIAIDPFMAFSGGLIMGFGEKIFVDGFQQKIAAVKF